MARNYEQLRAQLQQKKDELAGRLDRVTANVRRGYEADSEERAKQMEDHEVVDALGNDARAEIVKITAALSRIDAGDYGICKECGLDIDETRIEAHPYAEFCIECARDEEFRRAHR
ncbi:MAG: TraR/DksA family transcriptional regulator [Woeseiaceae bacterium]|nr:TraR/DksA family transcriptional regulator [Woeseiaceae bacterium]